MSLVGPPPVSTNPLLRLAGDIRTERAAPVPFPPGDTRPSLQRTKRFARDPLPVLLDAYERYGPVFTLRIFHGTRRLRARAGGQPLRHSSRTRTTSRGATGTWAT